MRRRTIVGLVVAAALVGCPIPQPLPDYPAGTITPPRIVVDSITNGATVVPVPAGCATAPTSDLAATLIDVNTFEVVRARWFINYDPSDSARYTPIQQNDISGVDSNPPVTERGVPAFTFRPYDGYPTIEGTGGNNGSNAGAVHIVELVVSNGFDPAVTGPPAARPFRTPLAGFETQLYRWTFFTVPESPPGCTAGTPGCVRCPP
jgi:hypothetical protein